MIRDVVVKMSADIFELDSDGETDDQFTEYTDKIGVGLFLSQLLPWVISVVNNAVAVRPEARCHLGVGVA